MAQIIFQVESRKNKNFLSKQELDRVVLGILYEETNDKWLTESNTEVIDSQTQR